MPNRLATATSPYLLQHADNPVDWWEWSDAAFAEAARRDVPVLLSIGYAACHWCHVMAHESFEDAATAEQLNADFVAIKVDREERPDIDAVYMAATQAMTGQGGWPMTCFLTPAGEPFHCGTYYPATPRAGMPTFRQLLDAVSRAWREDGARVRGAAGEITARLADSAAAALPPAGLDADALDEAAQTLAGGFDERNGGFGGAPKFPPSMVLEFLLRRHERTGSAEALRQVAVTAERMARGGLYDQLAGGFARYSVDAQWVVPHFEKMLYDNALLLRVYAHLARVTGAELPRRVAAETAAFLLRDLRTAEGGFASALDADTDGVEGLTYAWTPAQLRAVLGADDGDWAAELLAVTAEGTFEHGSSTLQLPADPDDPARWARVRAALLAARDRRPQPARDDKVITSWNGLAVLALAEGGAALGHPEWVSAAAEAAEFLLDRHLVDGRLRRSSRGGAVGAAAGVLEDHAGLADALLALHQATGVGALADRGHRAAGPRAGPLRRAGRQLLRHRRRRRGPVAPAARADRQRDPVRRVGAGLGAAHGVGAGRRAGPVPGRRPRRRCARSAAWPAGTRGSPGTGSARPRRGCADRCRWPWSATRATGSRCSRRPAGSPPAARSSWPGEPAAPGVPLLAERPLVDGGPAAYVCRGFVCDRPATTIEELAGQLRQ